MQHTVRLQSSRLFEVTSSTSLDVVSVHATLVMVHHGCWVVTGQRAILPSEMALWSGCGGRTTMPTVTCAVTSLKTPLIPKYSFLCQQHVHCVIMVRHGMRRLSYSILWSITALQISLTMTLTMVPVWDSLHHRLFIITISQQLLIIFTVHGHCTLLSLCLRYYCFFVCI